MMMAFDSSQTPPSRLDESVVAALREALRGYLATADAAPLRDALVALAADARAREMPPEQLLVVLKDLWGSLGEVRAMTDMGQQVRLQQRVVTMCIKEYFST